MAITYPMSLLDGAPFWSTDFDLLWRQEQSRQANGRTIVKDFGSPLWRATYQSVSLKPNELDYWRARLNSLENGLQTFYGRPTSRCYPIADPGGALSDRKNLLTWSQDFDKWAKAQVSVAANSIQSPDGTSTADTLTESLADSAHYMHQTVAAGTGAFTYTASIYVHESSARNVQLRFGNHWTSGSRAYATFDMATKTVQISGISISGETATMESVGDGWYRCIATATVTLAGQIAYVVVLNNDASVSSALPTYTGDGTSGIYIWGAQLEIGSEPTPYIKNDGTTGPVITSITDNKVLTFSGMAAALSVGDYIQIDETDLHQIVGIDGTSYEVRPHLWPAAAVGDAITISKPHCIMALVPGSVSTTADLSTGRGVVSFQAIEAR